MILLQYLHRKVTLHLEKFRSSGLNLATLCLGPSVSKCRNSSLSMKKTSEYLLVIVTTISSSSLSCWMAFNSVCGPRFKTFSVDVIQCHRLNSMEAVRSQGSSKWWNSIFHDAFLQYLVTLFHDNFVSSQFISSLSHHSVRSSNLPTMESLKFFLVQKSKVSWWWWLKISYSLSFPLDVVIGILNLEFFFKEGVVAPWMPSKYVAEKFQHL